jgi:hypothetical protein
MIPFTDKRDRSGTVGLSRVFVTFRHKFIGNSSADVTLRNLRSVSGRGVGRRVLYLAPFFETTGRGGDQRWHVSRNLTKDTT